MKDTVFNRQKRKDAKDFIFRVAKNAKRECFGKDRDYKLMVLRYAAKEEVPFRYAVGPYIERRGRVPKYECGERYWRNRGCFACGAMDNRQVHHIVTVKNGGTGDPVNLVMLCLSCHQSVHSGPRVHA